MLHRGTGFAKSAKPVSVFLGPQISPYTLALPQAAMGMKIIFTPLLPCSMLCEDGEGSGWEPQELS